jgi:hypothetical protein
MKNNIFTYNRMREKKEREWIGKENKPTKKYKILQRMTFGLVSSAPSLSPAIECDYPQSLL